VLFVNPTWFLPAIVAGGDAARAQPLGLGFLLVWSDNWGRWQRA